MVQQEMEIVSDCEDCICENMPQAYLYRIYTPYLHKHHRNTARSCQRQESQGNSKHLRRKRPPKVELRCSLRTLSSVELYSFMLGTFINILIRVLDSFIILQSYSILSLVLYCNNIYCIRWVALNIVCSEYMDHIKATQKELYSHIRESPTYAQAKRDIGDLAKRFLADVKTAQEDLAQKRQQSEDERKALEVAPAQEDPAQEDLTQEDPAQEDLAQEDPAQEDLAQKCQESEDEKKGLDGAPTEEL